jgi:hypothetical protein
MTEDILPPLKLQWIHDFRQEQRKYRDFYQEEVTHVPVICMYVGPDHTVAHVSHDYYALVTPGRIERSALMAIIEEKSVCPASHKRHAVAHVLSYIPALDPDDLQLFIQTDDIDTQSWLQDHSELSDIVYPPCISILHQLNALILIYRKEAKPGLDGSKSRVGHGHKHTKRLRLRADHKTTRRVQFKLCENDIKTE